MLKVAEEGVREEVGRMRLTLDELAREGHAGCCLPGSKRVFRDALAVARRQGARAYELRAAVGYARFLRDHGCAGEGRALLAPVYAAFTEGFDTRDLQDAKGSAGGAAVEEGRSEVRGVITPLSPSSC
jgi:hypothetical protein